MSCSLPQMQKVLFTCTYLTFSKSGLFRMVDDVLDEVLLKHLNTALNISLSFLEMLIVMYLGIEFCLFHCHVTTVAHVRAPPVYRSVYCWTYIMHFCTLSC